MPATAARVAFIQSEYRRVTSEDAAVVTRHGDLARESEDPVPTFFDSTANAQTIADARQDLLAPERRRFTVRVTGIEEALGINLLTGFIPTVQYVDPDRDCDRKMLVTGIVINLAEQRAEFGVWG